MRVNTRCINSIRGPSPKDVTHSGGVYVPCIYTRQVRGCTSGGVYVPCIYTRQVRGCTSGRVYVPCIYTHQVRGCTSGGVYVPCIYTRQVRGCSLCTLYLHTPGESYWRWFNVTLIRHTCKYKVHKLSYRRWLRSSLYLYYIFWGLINSLVYWLFPILSVPPYNFTVVSFPPHC